MQAGSITAFTISTPDLERSLAFYKNLGFSEVMRADWPFPWIQISDGVILIMLRKGDDPYFALTWYLASSEQAARELEEKGIAFTQKPAKGDALKRYLLKSPDGLNISLVTTPPGFMSPTGKSMLQMDAADYYRPWTYPNKVCGLFGELAHPVKNLQASIAFWKLLGLEVKSEFASPYPWAIMTDGKTVVGLHQSNHFDYPAITYFAADMDDKIAALGRNVSSLEFKNPGNAVVTTPEGQKIFLFSMAGAPEAEVQDIDSLPHVVLETERLLIKELTAEMMAGLMTAMTKKEIMEYLGLQADAELEREQANFENGYSWYRSTARNFIITDKQSGKTLGRVGFNTWYEAHDRAEIGYNIAREEDKRKGYMK